MSDAGRKTDTPLPTYRNGNVQVPVKTLLTFLGACLVVGAGLVTKFVYATKAELVEHAAKEGERVTVVEQTEKHHDDSIAELKKDVKDTRADVGAVLENVNTVLREIGVSERRIAKPKK
jgi:hypothetical protein